MFTFSLPFDAIYDAADPVSTSRVITRGKRVLVMDDNPTNRRVLCGQLQPVGFDVVAAATAAETLKTLREAQQAGTPFDVVIADDEMPDSDGVGFAAQSQIRAGARAHAAHPAHFDGSSGERRAASRARASPLT